MQRSEGRGRPGARGGAGAGQAHTSWGAMGPPSRSPCILEVFQEESGKREASPRGAWEAARRHWHSFPASWELSPPRSRVRHKRSHIQERAQAPSAAHLHPYLMPGQQRQAQGPSWDAWMPWPGRHSPGQATSHIRLSAIWSLGPGRVSARPTTPDGLKVPPGGTGYLCSSRTPPRGPTSFSSSLRGGGGPILGPRVFGETAQIGSPGPLGTQPMGQSRQWTGSTRTQPLS